MEKKQRPGRPPAATAIDGAPAQVSKWPKVTLAVRPEVKNALDAIAFMRDEPQWQTFERAITEMVQRLPAPERAFVAEAGARRRKS